jgi:hypothetical protein
VRVPLRVTVALRVCVWDLVSVCDALRVRVCVGDCVALGVELPVGVSVCELVRDTEGVPVTLGVCVALGVDVELEVLVLLELLLWLGDPERDGVCVSDPVPDCDFVFDGVDEDVRDPVPVPSGDCDPL